MLFGGVSSFYDASGAIKPGFGLSLDENGYLKVKIPGSDDAFLGIRPLDSASAYPGDDLLLEFGIAKAKTSVAIARDALPDSDYLAVYDKKMLWRANLYIHQVETDETGTATDDWNNLHPWNAPPVVGTVVQGGSNPVWGRPGQMDDDSAWDGTRWGYNEWNRSWSDTTQLSTTGLISGLQPGDGRQTIVLPEYTPIHPVDTSAARQSNFLSGRVAYSFPYQYQDGHFDSPFDFKKKLLTEMASLKNAYKANIVSAFTSTTTVGGTMIAGGPSQETLENWTSTRAPSNVWGRYLMQNFYLVEEINGVASGHHKSFVPSLGLLNYKLADQGENTGQSSIVMNKYFNDELVDGAIPILSGSAARPAEDNDDSPYPAGTDCIGFAQRTAQYRGNLYIWESLVAGWAEGGGLSMPDVTTTAWDESAQGRVYPRAGDRSWEIFERGDTEFSILVEYEHLYKPEQQKISCIVPGDIWYSAGHIAIVSDVKWHSDGRVKNIRLIESTFGYNSDSSLYSQSIIRDRTLAGDYLVAKGSYSVVRLRR